MGGYLTIVTNVVVKTQFDEINYAFTTNLVFLTILSNRPNAFLWVCNRNEPYQTEPNRTEPPKDIAQIFSFVKR